jgi:hypothetical protein
MEQVVVNSTASCAAGATTSATATRRGSSRPSIPYVRLRLARLASVKHGRSGRNWTTRYNYAWSQRLGVAWLVGTVRSGAVYAQR